jgi:hypothetical protein
MFYLIFLLGHIVLVTELMARLCRMQSLANLWICAREILWLAHPRPSGKLLTLIKAMLASSLRGWEIQIVWYSYACTSC